MMRVSLVSAAFDPHAALAEFNAGRADHGAMVSFIGACRGASHGAKVETLELQHYPGFTEAEITLLAETITRKHDLLDLLILHRVGAMVPGEAIVLVAALSAHRAAAFKAVEEIMDYLKTDAPLWKREIGPGGARWIEPTPDDYARRAKNEDRT